MTQLSIEITNKAIAKAEDHANLVHGNWSDQAYNFLLAYIKDNPSFMTEDVRFAAQGKVPNPPSQRAWGSIVRKAAVAGLIRHVSYKNVKNIKAHRAMASVWHRN